MEYISPKAEEEDDGKAEADDGHTTPNVRDDLQSLCFSRVILLTDECKSFITPSYALQSRISKLKWMQ